MEKEDKRTTLLRKDKTRSTVCSTVCSTAFVSVSVVSPPLKHPVTLLVCGAR